jgi:hypothetical protein
VANSIRVRGMANEQNLKPFTSEQSREEAKKNGRKGGIASGEARRKKADFRNDLQNALLGTYKTKSGKELTGSELLIESMMQIAGNPKNKGAAVAAFKTLATMLGQDVPESNSDDDDQVRAFLKAIRDE